MAEELAGSEIRYFDTIVLSQGENRLLSCQQWKDLGFMSAGKYFVPSFRNWECLWMLVPKEANGKEFVENEDEMYLVHAITGMYMKKEAWFEHKIAELRWNDGDDSFVWKIASADCTGVISDGCQITLRNGCDYLEPKLKNPDLENSVKVGTRDYYCSEVVVIVSKFDRFADFKKLEQETTTRINELKQEYFANLASVKEENSGLVEKLKTAKAQSEEHYEELQKAQLEIKHLQDKIGSLKLVSDAKLFNQTFVTSNNLSSAFYAIDGHQELKLRTSLIQKVSSSSTICDDKNALTVGTKQLIVPKALFFAMASSLGLLVIVLIIIGVIWCVQRWKKSKATMLNEFNAEDDDVTVGVVRHTVDINPVFKEMDKPKLKPMDEWKSVAMTKKLDSDEDLFDSMPVDEGTGTGTSC